MSFWGSSKASPEEIEASMKPKKRRGKATAAKAAPARGTKKVEPPSPPKDATPAKPPPVKKVAKDPDGGNTDIKPRRLAFKGPDPDKNRQVSSLQEDWLSFSKSGLNKTISSYIPRICILKQLF